jgi:DNA-binding protein HU-beta
MNKQELVEKVSAELGCTQKDAKSTVETIVKVFAETLQKGEKISLTGFGTLDVVKSNARVGRNPKTGAPVQIAAKNKVKFKAGKDLIAEVNA